jgi:streptogramin lyase
MKYSSFLARLSSSCIVSAVFLTGCSSSVVFPDTASEVSPGAIHGSVFGGHAPIVGAHVYVLEAGQTGYASASKSKLTTGAGTDSVGTYVLTDGSGSFNITGDYTCDATHPVYLAAAGGSTISANITITAASETANGANYTLTFTGANSLAAGQTVTFSGLNGNYTVLNGLTETVTAQTATTFTVAYKGTPNTISGTATGTATPNVNAAIVNMAVLGLCPSTPNLFANTLSYVYMNEVSTVAAAYAFAGFGSGPYAVGASATNLLGIQNAAVNAGQLYDIQGSSQSTVPDGEGHIARSITPALNGIVPESTLDTLGNILAACVDSSGASSATCTSLLTTATANGKTGGTAAPDTATAAFNIAHFPAGSGNTNFVKTLYQLPTGAVPFSPNLGTQPNDFTIGISYPQSLNGYWGEPESIAVDGKGNVWVSNANSQYIVKLLPTGAYSFGAKQAAVPGYLSIDPSNNVWFGSIAGTTITELNNAGSVISGAGYSAGLSTVSSSVTDGAGNAYFITEGGNTASLIELTSGGTAATNSPFSASATCVPNNNGYDHLAIDGSSELWSADEHSGTICRYTTGGATAKGFPINLNSSTVYPEVIGIDASGTAWVTLEGNNTVDMITIQNGNNNPTATTLTSASTGATFNEPFSVAIDGAGNVWITNRNSASIAELNNNGTAISPTKNYQGGGMNDPLNAAIDGSGDVWITNYGGNEVVELVGAATPTATPLSALKLGTTP